MKKVKTVYDHIRGNNLKTILLVALFPMIFITLVFLFSWIVVPASDALQVALGVAIPTAAACLNWSGISWAFGDSMILSVAGAHEIHDTDPANREIFRSVENVALATNDDIIIIDAEREYGDLTRALGGAVIEISPNSPHHINPLEITRGYGTGENPVAMKSELLMSICEQQMGAGQLGAFHKSIIDRCTASVYHELIASGGKSRQPILSDWRNELKRQPEREAEELALASELFVEGSLNMFAHETNVDIANRIISFDLYEMGEQLKPTALNVTLETIQNRVAANRLAGKYTWVFVDEVYLFFRYYYSAQFLYKCWKRFRKYAAAMTAATQNVEECLRSDTARLMFANSEFLVLLNQAATDRAELAKLLNISTNQMSYITSAEAGHGLIRVGGSIVPFANEFRRDTELYRLMTTTPGDR